MKIWILTSETPHYWAGGIARYVDNFARAASSSSHEITVISRGPAAGERRITDHYRLIEFEHLFEASKTPGNSSEPDEHPGWPYNNMAYFAALSYQCAEEVGELVRQEGAPDIIECQDYAALAYFLLQRKLTHPDFLRDIPVLLHLHTPDYAVQRANQYPRFKLPDYWTGRMERACIWMADAVLAPSRFIVDALAEEMEGEMPEVTIIPYPWPELQVESGICGGGDDRIVCPGRIELRKGVEPLLAACEMLWREGRTFVLEMVGGDVHTPLKGGSLTAYLKNRYAHRVESGNLVFTGPMEHAACLRKMREASAVVIPSLFENFPNTCIEAMSLGKLVVASREGGQAEMLGTEDPAGILFSHAEEGNLKNALVRALETSPEDRLRMGQAAYDRIRQVCSPKHVVPRRIAHYQEVIEQHAPKSHFPFTNRRLRNGPRAVPFADEPLISVVVPYYNLGAYLSDCLESIFRSEGVSFEVVVVNDGSTDPASIGTLDAWRARTDRAIRILDIPNGGLANARNLGASAARGELVAFVDADDRIGPHFLRRSVDILKRYPNVHLAYSWVRFFDEGHGIWQSWTFDLPYLLCHNQLVPLVVVRKDSFLRHGLNKPHIVYGLEDYEGWISMAEAGCGGVAIPEPLVEYRVRSNSMFKVIDGDKKLYLYDLISAEHPALYAEYGLELFNLQNANGPGYGWDQPTMFRSPQDRLLGQANADAEKAAYLEAQNGQLHKDVAWLQKERNRLLAEQG